MAATKIARPTLDDVQRLSEGRAARTRGWGSRQVCHRLNQDERTQYNLALEKGFLTIKGTGYRKERKGAPLANIYRQYCDAKGIPCVNVLLAGTKSVVLVERSTTRRWAVGEDGLEIDEVVAEEVRLCMAEHGSGGGGGLVWLTPMELAEVVPWTVLAPPEVIARNTAEGLDEDVMEHYCQSAIWQVPVSVVGASVEDRATAKAMAARLGHSSG